MSAPRRLFQSDGDGSSDAAMAFVTRQGAWFLLGLVAASGLGLLFWGLAARLFPKTDVGIAGSLVTLSFFGAGVAMFGFDAGLVRFAPQVRHPRTLIRTILIITGLLAGAVGLVLPLFILTVGKTDSGFWPLVGLTLALTVWNTWSFVMNGAFLAAGKSFVSAAALVGAGVFKIALLLAVVSFGVVGLFGAYVLPLLAIVVAGALLIPRYWPAENVRGTAHSLREVAALSFGNWIAGFGYILPYLAGPAIVLIFYDASAAAFFFIALQLADILNYGSEALAKALFAHGAREDRLARSLVSRVRNLILVILVPLVAIGVAAAPFIGSIVAGAEYGAHPLYIQLFLLAALPRSSYQVLLAQFNVARRVRAVTICGATFGILTIAGLLIGLRLGVSADVLPSAWILGGVGALLVGWYLAGRTPASTDASPGLP